MSNGSQSKINYDDEWFNIFLHTMCECTCCTLSSSAADRGDYTVSVAKAVLPPAAYATGQSMEFVFLFHVLI